MGTFKINYVALEVDRLVMVGRNVCVRLDNGGLYHDETYGVTSRTRLHEISDDPVEELDGRSVRHWEAVRRRLLRAIKRGEIGKAVVKKKTEDLKDEKVMLHLVSEVLQGEKGSVPILLEAITRGKITPELYRNRAVRQALQERASAIASVAKLQIADKWDDVYALICDVLGGKVELTAQRERMVKDLMTIIMSEDKDIGAGSGSGLESVIAEFYASDGSVSKVGIARRKE